MRWLYKLEYKFGRYYIKYLMPVIIAGMAVVYIGDMVMGYSLGYSMSYFVAFSRDLIFRGEIWRVISFIFTPPGGSILPNVGALATVNNMMHPLFVLMVMYFIFSVGRSLETMWGGFRLTVFYLMGILCAILGGFITPMGFTTNTYLNSSLFLALATAMPEANFRLFFMIPLKSKWFILVFFALDLYSILQAFLIYVPLGLSHLILFALSLVPYLVYFGPALWRQFNDWLRIRRNRRNWRNGTR